MDTISLPRMPSLWDIDKLLIHHDYLFGALAKWAVAQSPYTVPENLGEAVEQFASKWPHPDWYEIGGPNLKPTIRETIEQCPLIMAWNNPKKGNHEIVFVTRDSGPAPDYDFIDLDALAHNIAHEMILNEQVERAQDAEPKGDQNDYDRSFPEILHDLRRDDFMVAVHNDYRLNGIQHTFWLMTKGEIALKGEGRTDLEALQQINTRAHELGII